MRFSSLLAGLALASTTFAQVVTYCAAGNVCYAVNVPRLTASGTTGDIYFQMSGPATMSWIGLGQGRSMSDANIFMMYSNAAGNNVTVSPRLGVGNRAPATSGSTAELTVLAGSGISNGQMVANVRCSNCGTWSGGSMSFTDPSSDWIWAYQSGSPINSDNLDVSLRQHNRYGSTTFNLQQAAGGNSANPFATTVATPVAGGGANTTDAAAGQTAADRKFNRILITHGVLGPIAFVIFYPLGAIGIRLFSFKGLVWMHAGWMVFTYCVVIASAGLGIWMAVVSDVFNEPHVIIGLTVLAALIFQPITGLAHHLLYKRVGRPNAATYPHIWWGRAIITLGIINGGLGLRLSANTRAGDIAYGVVAGIMWLVWMVVIILAFLRSRTPKGETGDGAMRLSNNDSRTRMAQQNSPHMQESFAPGERPMSQESTVVAESFHRG